MAKREGRFGLPRNVGGIDRVARAATAVVFLAVGVLAVVVNQPTLAFGAVIVSAALGFNAVTGFCWMNALFGIDTCSWDGAEDG